MPDIGGTLWGYVQDGGPVMWPLLAFSVVALAFIVERFIALRRARINVNEFSTYVAVARDIAAQVLQRLLAGRIKGRSVKLRLLD